MQYTKFTVGTLYEVGGWPGSHICNVVIKIGKDGFIEKAKSYVRYFKNQKPVWYDIEEERFLTPEEVENIIVKGKQEYDRLQNIDNEKERLVKRMGMASFITCDRCKEKIYKDGEQEENFGEYEEHYTWNLYNQGDFAKELYEKGWRNYYGHMLCPVCYEKAKRKEEREVRKKERKKIVKGLRKKIVKEK